MHLNQAFYLQGYHRGPLRRDLKFTTRSGKTLGPYGKLPHTDTDTEENGPYKQFFSNPSDMMLAYISGTVNSDLYNLNFHWRPMARRPLL